MPPIIILTGGGIKGAVAAARRASDNELVLVHVDYGQPSARAEVKALRDLAETFSSARVVALDLPHVRQLQQDSADSRSSPGGGNPRRGEASSLAAPSRGLVPVLMSVGVQCAMRFGAATVATGLSRLCDATHFGMPPVEEAIDGRREFVYAFNLMIESLSAQRSKVRMEAPLMDVDYGQMVKLAQRFGVPLEKTWTCEQSRTQPCGRCNPCKARARAFIEAALVDPLIVGTPAPA